MLSDLDSNDIDKIISLLCCSFIVATESVGLWSRAIVKLVEMSDSLHLTLVVSRKKKGRPPSDAQMAQGVFFVRNLGISQPSYMC